MFAILHRYAKQKQKRSEDEWAQKKQKCTMRRQLRLFITVGLV